ncbi:hypothetical protein HB852_07445 [Listeria grandensis]|uniref:Polysaccharide chain length determinant N-terminal domain-containing protein n=1 Tax=Listeria grandensis TaxID=1494963 RepID=A0A7X1CPG8_9LIST|nr:Wzz/FepE/Etk N-terminal domain-containing protein [Listeria grandensis]MBC1474449.1 hypothetical protein [Listeria grandensis]MBC1935995.1 hypothetical protein [Listeria grandensis]
MDIFRNYINKLLKRWYLILVFSLFFMFCVYVVQSNFVDTEYESNIELLVLPSEGKDDSEASRIDEANVRVSIQLMNTYMNIIRSTKVLKAVKKELKLGDSVQQLENSITVSSNENSLSMNIAVKSNASEKSKEIAITTARITKEQIQRYFAGNQIIVLNNAVTGTPISSKIYYIVAGVIGAWTGMIYIFIELLSVRKIRDEIDIQQFGIPVLGIIGYSKEKGKKSFVKK